MPDKSDRPLTEGIKAKLDDLELERRITQLTAQAEELVVRGIAKAGEAAHDNRDRIEGLLDRAEHAVDDHGAGKYAERFTQLRGQVERGVDRLAERRPESDL